MKKTALLLGGSSGIGLATAKLLLSKGYRVVIIGRREETVQDSLAILKKLGEASGYVADVSDKKSTERLIDIIKKDVLHIDFFVNSVGVFNPKPFLDHTSDDYDYNLNINKGVFFILQQVIRNMVDNSIKGSIVNVGSIWANFSTPSLPAPAYAMKHAGIHALTKHLAVEFAPKGIRINAVAPATVETDVYTSILPKEQLHESLQSFNAFHPIGRIGQPEDIATAIGFLLSAEAGWITGQVLNVDGGVTVSRSS
ncbi:MAG: SDR family oxidoreductase [Flammeovirgaceae bacterium]|jgi:NAD(P)-dependent dehydrogenase (short-subunit alcohol dehydrogenase family)|nr:SDR family oxidoreductase [Flammeovirgaceae bacterium]